MDVRTSKSVVSKRKCGRPRGPNYRPRNRGHGNKIKSFETGYSRRCAYEPCQRMFYPKHGQVERQRFCSKKCKAADYHAKEEHSDPRGVKRPENQRQRLRREALSLYEHLCVFCKLQQEEVDLFARVPAGYEYDALHAIIVCRNCSHKNHSSKRLAVTRQVQETFIQRGLHWHG
jgi:hypothetical protein